VARVGSHVATDRLRERALKEASVFQDWPVTMCPPTRRMVDPPKAVFVDLNRLIVNPDDAFRRDEGRPANQERRLRLSRSRAWTSPRVGAIHPRWMASVGYVRRSDGKWSGPPHDEAVVPRPGRDTSSVTRSTNPRDGVLACEAVVGEGYCDCCG